MSILKRCKACKKLRFSFLVKRQKIKIPIGKVALSKEEMCWWCIRRLQKALDRK